MSVKSLLAFTTSAGVLAVLAACQSAVNLDVQYTDAGGGNSLTTVPPAPDAGTPAAPDAAPAAEAGPEVPGVELEACPCDATLGLACCVSNAGNNSPSFCTTDQAFCRGEKGGFYRCFGPDPSTESVCCLRRGDGTFETGLAGECKQGTVTVCRVNADCPNNGTCNVKACKDGVSLGVCDDQPACPP